MADGHGEVENCWKDLNASYGVVIYSKVFRRFSSAYGTGCKTATNMLSVLVLCNSPAPLTFPAARETYSRRGALFQEEGFIEVMARQSNFQLARKHKSRQQK